MSQGGRRRIAFPGPGESSRGDLVAVSCTHSMLIQLDIRKHELTRTIVKPSVAKQHAFSVFTATFYPRLCDDAFQAKKKK